MPDPSDFELSRQAATRVRARVLNLTDLELAAVMAVTIDEAKAAEESGAWRIGQFWHSTMLLVNEERCRRESIYADAFSAE